MFSEVRRLFTRYCLINTVIACGVLFFCGTLTASQKTAYNIWLREYSVMSMSNTSESISMSIDEESYRLPLPDADTTQKLIRYLKLTPLASTVYFVESIAEQLSIHNRGETELQR